MTPDVFHIHLLLRKTNKETSKSYFLYFLKLSLSEKHTHKKKKKEKVSWSKRGRAAAGSRLISSVSLQATRPQTRLCFQSPRRPSCGTPCWRRPPGTRRGRTGCKLKDRQEVSTDGSRHVTPQRERHSPPASQNSLWRWKK